jgi:hypothetical protein
MKNNRQEIIDFIIDNDDMIREMISKTNTKILNVDPLFKEEALKQQAEEISRNLSDEIGNRLGLTSSDLNDILDMETLRKIMEVL